MKRAALFCLICALTVFAAGALAAPGDATLYTREQLKELEDAQWYDSSILAVVGDTVYARVGQAIYAWQAGQEKPVKVAGDIPDNYGSYEDAVEQIGEKADTIISGLVADGETLYALNNLNGKLSPISFQEGKAVFGTPVQLDWADMVKDHGDYTSIRQLYRTAIVQGRLYAMIRNDEDYYKPDFASFDLATGERRLYKVPFVMDFTPYKDGKLLLKIYDMENAYREGGAEPAKPTLSVFDPADGSAAQAGVFGHANASGLVYQPETDTLLYAANSRLMAMKALGSPAQVAYLPMDYGDDSPALLLPGGLYAIGTWNGLFVRNTDPQYMPASSLSVYGGYMDAAAMAFTLQYPQVPLTIPENVYFESMDQWARAMTSGDQAIDVYHISVSYEDFGNLMEKGYCVDLGESPSLLEKIGKMYPFLLEAVQKDGRLYAMPVDMYGDGLSIGVKAWKEAGLEEKIPTSFLGVLEFMDWWSREGVAQHPDVKLMQGVSDYRQTLFNMIVNQYVYECQRQGQELSFDTPLFRKLMQALENIDIDALNDTLPPESEMEEMMYDETSALFSPHGEWLSVYDSTYYEEYAKPLVVPMEEGGKAGIPVYMRAIFINPNTKNKEMALKYLEICLDKLEDTQRVMMFPDENEGVPNADYERMLKIWQEELDKQKERLKKAKPELVKEIESTIKFYEEALANKERYYWNINPKDIKRYRQMAEYCFPAVTNLLDYRTKEGTSEIRTLMDRYRQKQMSMDQFIAEADKKIRMILLERR